jgi:hypothetical protein
MVQSVPVVQFNNANRKQSISEQVIISLSVLDQAEISPTPPLRPVTAVPPALGLRCIAAELSSK